MIPPAQHAEIRRLFYAEHWRVGTIASTLGVHPDTVRRAIEHDRFVRIGAQIRPSLLDPYKAFITATLDQYPRLRATRLFAMLRDRGFAGSVVQLRRYVRAVRPTARAEAYLRLETLRAEQAQIDWGNFGPIQIGCARRALSCFVLVLSWSRAVYARFALDQTLESFLRGHVEAFAALGGSPRTLLYDNLKSVVLERFGEHIRFHPRLLELAGHYHFAPQPCAVARGNEKGRVERMIQYLRQAFFPARRFTSIDALNAQLAQCITDTAHQRPVPGDPTGRRVADAGRGTPPVAAAALAPLRVRPRPGRQLRQDPVPALRRQRLLHPPHADPATAHARGLRTPRSRPRRDHRGRRPPPHLRPRPAHRGRGPLGRPHRRQAPCARPARPGSPPPGLSPRRRLPRRSRPPRRALGPPHDRPAPAPRRV